MVSAILRPLFKRMARGAQDPRARSFAAFGIAPMAVNRLTDPSDEVVNQLLYPTESQDDVTTDIDTNINVTTKDPEPKGPVDKGGFIAAADKNSKVEEEFNESSLTNENINKEENDFTSSESNNNPSIGDYIDNDSVKRINNYKDVIKNFIGDSSGNKLQKVALLMQIGSSLMAGRTDQPGLRGFFDVIGQTGQQTAPLLFEMGV